MKMKSGEGSTNETVKIPLCDDGNFTSYGCEHDSENACTLIQSNEYDLHALRN
jgi:hypothetical protein